MQSDSVSDRNATLPRGDGSPMTPAVNERSSVLLETTENADRLFARAHENITRNSGSHRTRNS